MIFVPFVTLRFYGGGGGEEGEEEQETRDYMTSPKGKKSPG